MANGNVGRVEIAVPEVSAAMTAVSQQAQDLRLAHESMPPYLPAAAAGRGFIGYADRLQRAFDIVHQRGTLRFSAMDETARAAVALFGTVAGADDAAARALDSVGGV